MSQVTDHNSSHSPLLCFPFGVIFFRCIISGSNYHIFTTLMGNQHNLQNIHAWMCVRAHVCANCIHNILWYIIVYCWHSGIGIDLKFTLHCLFHHMDGIPCTEWNAMTRVTDSPGINCSQYYICIACKFNYYNKENFSISGWVMMMMMMMHLAFYSTKNTAALSFNTHAHHN